MNAPLFHFPEYSPKKQYFQYCVKLHNPHFILNHMCVQQPKALLRTSRASNKKFFWLLNLNDGDHSSGENSSIAFEEFRERGDVSRFQLADDFQKTEIRKEKYDSGNHKAICAGKHISSGDEYDSGTEE